MLHFKGAMYSFFMRLLLQMKLYKNFNEGAKLSEVFIKRLSDYIS